METLSKLFGSSAKVKIMRLFLANPDTVFNNDETSKRAKVSLVITKKEIKNLKKIKLIKDKVFYREREVTSSASRRKDGKGKKVTIEKKKIKGWILNEKFPLIVPLRNLLIKSNRLEKNEIIDRLKGAGLLKLVIVSGTFIQDEDSRVDTLVVGDSLNNHYWDRAF